MTRRVRAFLCCWFPFDTFVSAFYDPRAMGDGLTSWRAVLMVVLGCCSAIACDRRTPVATTAQHGPRVASLVPAATDMLLGMGAGEHLVAVSNYETSARVAKLPRVGDYQTTDWETLARLRPDAMIIQIAPDRLPPGLKQRADELHIALVNVKIDRLQDVFATMECSPAPDAPFPPAWTREIEPAGAAIFTGPMAS